MFKITILIFPLFLFEPHIVSSDCSRFIPTPIWNFTQLTLSSWRISGVLDSNLQTNMRYLEMGSSWNSVNETTFEIWTYGTMIDLDGQQLAFDSWYQAKRLDVNRPGDLALSYLWGEEIVSNTTILFFDVNTILWVDCDLDPLRKERAYMGSSSGSLSDLQKEQFKSILKFDYGMDVDNYYVNIPQEPFIDRSTPGNE